MCVTVLFFGSLAESVGKRECNLNVNGQMTLADVVKAVGGEGFQPLLVAVNQKQVNDMNLLINNGDEVALMSPFSGG